MAQTFGIQILTLAPNLVNIQHNKTTTYLLGACGAASSSSGVAQGDPMIESISTNAPYTRNWFKSMLSYNFYTLHNAAYDGTNLYYVYTNSSTYATMFHAIDGATGNDVYAPVQLSTGDVMGAFSTKSGVFIVYDDSASTPSFKSISLLTGAITTGLSIPSANSNAWWWYGNPIFTGNDTFVQLYYDTTSIRCAILDKTASGVTIPIKVNGTLVPPPTQHPTFGYAVSPVGTKSLYAVNTEASEVAKFTIP